MIGRAGLRIAFAVSVCVLGTSTTGWAVPWVLYEDPVSGSICDVVNAANLELVVLANTGELVGVTGSDVVFVGTFVDEEGFVYYDGFAAGYIDFATDGDRMRTLWWFLDVGDVANVNEFTGEPTSSGLDARSFVNVPCDACPLWDEPADCSDSDLDGVVDRFDLCPGTPLDEIADDDGCSCSQYDSDGDGVDDCVDFCPATPLLEVADGFGCSCSQRDLDADGVDDCLDFCPDTPPGSFVGVDGCACAELDSDGDGINDCFDLCPMTPLDEFADIDGCSCSQLDTDGDGVDDCWDLCPGTRTAAPVDVVGCEIGGSPSGPVVVNICGSAGPMSLMMMFVGFAALHFVAARRL